MGNRWSKEKINAWYEERPWLMGCNYVPAVTLHNTELWRTIQGKRFLRL